MSFLNLFGSDSKTYTSIDQSSSATAPNLDGLWAGLNLAPPGDRKYSTLPAAITSFQDLPTPIAYNDADPAPFFDWHDQVYNAPDQAPSNGGGSQAPITPITVSSSGANSPTTITTNYVPTATVGYNTAPVLANVNAGGGVSVTTNSYTSTTDHGALDLAGLITGKALDFATRNNGAVLDFARDTNTGAYGLVAGGVGSALKIVQNNNDQFYTTTQQLLNSNNAFAGSAINAITDQSGRIVAGLGGELHSAIANITQGNSDVLSFFGNQVAKLQSATVGAIDEVALRNQSASSQGTADLQKTFTKLAIGLGVVIVAVVFIARGRNL